MLPFPAIIIGTDILREPHIVRLVRRDRQFRSARTPRAISLLRNERERDSPADLLAGE